MRAIAVTPETKQVGLIDIPEPRLCSPTDVKLRMLEAGVCGASSCLSGLRRVPANLPENC